MRAGSLVRVGVVEVARLVATQSAQGIEDVVEDVVLADPGVVLLETAGQKVHAVGGAEREVAVLGVDEVLAVGRVDVLVGHLDGATGGGLLGGGEAGVEVVPGIIADVVGAFGLVDAEEVDGAVLVGEGDADVCAVDRVGPVGDAIGVDLGGGVSIGSKTRGRCLTLHPKTPIEEEKASWGVAQTVPLSRWRLRWRLTGEDLVETSEMSREWMSSDKKLGRGMTEKKRERENDDV